MTPSTPRAFLRSIKEQALRLDSSRLALTALQIEWAIAARDSECIRFNITTAVQQLLSRVQKLHTVQHNYRAETWRTQNASADALTLTRLAMQGAELIERFAAGEAKPKRKTVLRAVAKAA